MILEGEDYGSKVSINAIVGLLRAPRTVDLAELGAPCRRPNNPSQERQLLKALFHIVDEVFIPAQRRHIDMHMLAMFFHDR